MIQEEAKADEPANEPQLLIIIVERETAIERLLEGLYEMGVRATVLRSEGMKQTLQEDVPLFAGLLSASAGGPTHHRTIMSVISDPVLLDAALELASGVCADFPGEPTGVAFVLPITSYRHL